MKIVDHQFKGEGVKFQQTPNISRGVTIIPDTIIIHYTATPNAASAINTLMNPKQSASAHLVVDIDGTVTQLANFNAKTWHAGVSSYGGRSNFNNFSIGIEIVNAGWLKKEGDKYYSYWGEEIKDVHEGLHRNYPQTRSQYWQKYSDAQIAKIKEICEALAETYDIQYILGHEEIAPGRKQDPGPAFPLDRLRDDILFNDEELPPDTFGVVVPDTLNIRLLPDITSEKAMNGALFKNDKVEVTRKRKDWLRVTTELSGWVSKKYLEADNTDDKWDARITASRLNLRNSPAGSEVLSVLVAETPVVILESDEEWIKVKVDIEGWVAERYIRLEESYGKVTVDLLNIRSEPHAEAKKVARGITKGTHLRILKEQGDWYKVLAPITGWVSSKFIKEASEGKWNAMITASKLNIRVEPDGELLAEPLLRGTLVKNLQTKGEWCKVMTEITGWVTAKYVDKTMVLLQDKQRTK